MIFADLLDLIVDLGMRLYDGMISVFDVFTMTPYSLIYKYLLGSESVFGQTFPAVSSIIGLVGIDLFPYTLIDLMFGVGLPLAIAWIFVTWILNVIT